MLIKVENCLCSNRYYAFTEYPWNQRKIL